MKKLQAIRGMNDILPEQVDLWQRVEKELQQLLNAYAYQEIRLPLLEKTELFKRSIGEATDIVEKEMYTFSDRNQESLTLRPEGTASCVRAAIEHGLLYNQQQKLWYSGPMFRYERPQKGRYRQFYQYGVETFGFTSPSIEAELNFILARLWKNLGLTSQVQLQINSLGSPESRAAYRDKFVAYCRNNIEALDEDSVRRLETNPLRILDSKNPEMQTLLNDAPKLQDFLDDASKAHFKTLCALFDDAKLPYVVNPRLVRGLDYYTGTVFEWVTESLGAQGAVCAGGRYDNLVQELGGDTVPAVGFAIGMERVIALMGLLQTEAKPQVDAYFIFSDEESERQGILITEQLHDQLPGLRIQLNLTGGSFKSQFKRADKSGARYALIIGEDERRTNMITCKDLRMPGGGQDNALSHQQEGSLKPGEQKTFSMESLIDYLRSMQWPI